MTLKNRYCTVEEAARIIGCTTGRVRQFITQGRLKGEKAGNKKTSAWLLYREGVEEFAKLDRPGGRPPADAMKDEVLKDVLATNVRRLLEQRGWSQTYLAKESGEPLMTINRLVRGENLAGAGVIRRVAATFDVSIDSLFADNGADLTP